MKQTQNELPDNEQRVYDILCTHSPNWVMSDTIATTLGRFQNHTAKLLSFLINKGLAESRPVVKDGKKMKYYEYRRKPQEVPQSIPDKEVVNHTAKPDLKKEPIVSENNYVNIHAPQECIDCPTYYRCAEVGEKCNKCGVLV